MPNISRGAGAFACHSFEAFANSRARERREISAAKRFGFTLIEMMIVMAIIVTLISLAVPYYQKSLIRAKESVLRSNLHTLRMAIDEYSFDKQKAPSTLQDLVTDGYIRDVPKDPVTQSNTTWRLIMEEAGQAVSATEPGIFDVRSGSDKKSMEGTAYSDW
jgi:general secretion pathway protein G